MEKRVNPVYPVFVKNVWICSAFWSQIQRSSCTVAACTWVSGRPDNGDALKVPGFILLDTGLGNVFQIVRNGKIASKIIF